MLRLIFFSALSLLTAPALHAAVILQYHHISTETPASTSTSPEWFAMHLDYLHEAGFDIVPLTDLVAHLRAGQPLPDKTAAITFDDGYISIYDTAWPMLKEKGWPFTVFVNTEPHDRGRPLFMSWAQLREIRAGGATIANHGVTHPYLLQRQPGHDEAAWKAWVAAEIVDAEERIAEQTGDNVKLFAYPYGEYNEAILKIVDELGFTGFGQHSGPLASFSDPRALPRFPFGGPYGDADDFAAKVNSLPMPLARNPLGKRLESADGNPLEDIVLHGPAARPVLLLKFTDGFDSGRLSCFVSRQGRAELSMEDGWIRVQPLKDLGRGRSRYNCTAGSVQAGRFHWYSQPWIIN
jgi:peptidoglycan/xylan/chitin deacetylase (PgdA/CDA1 family)